MRLLLLISTATTALGAYNHDNCYRALAGYSASASAFCTTYTTQTQTVTTGLPAYATPRSSSAPRLSSACSCVFPLPTTLPATTTGTTAASSTPSPIIYASYRNGDFSQVPYGPNQVNTNEAPWCTVRSINATIEYIDYGGVSYATFSMHGQTYAQGNTFARIETPITVHQQTSSTISFLALQTHPQKQNCITEIGWNASNYGTVFPSQFHNVSTGHTATFQSTYLGPTPDNPDGTFNTSLSLRASCSGIRGRLAADVTVQVSGVVVKPA